LLQWHPVFLRTFVATILPGLFLPDRVVVKKIMPGWLDEFENERPFTNSFKASRAM
jgi:hypothetical protein